jgi:hypothetical protein
MDEKDFKKHLADLVHGHHHPEEHDWSPDDSGRQTGKGVKTTSQKPTKAVARKARRWPK